MAEAKEAWEPTLEDPVIQEYIRDRVGEDGLRVAQLILDKQPIQGVDILDILDDKKPSDVRKILYRLEDARVAEYMKDTDKTGWETFVWRMTLNEVKYLTNKERHTLIHQLASELDLEEQNSFYVCPNDHGRIIFEDGLALEFRCPDCGEMLEFVDNEQRIVDLRKALEALKNLVF